MARKNDPNALVFSAEPLLFGQMQTLVQNLTWRFAKTARARRHSYLILMPSAVVVMALTVREGFDFVNTNLYALSDLILATLFNDG